jgi:hypothetical protein
MGIILMGDIEEATKDGSGDGSFLGDRRIFFRKCLEHLKLSPRQISIIILN